MKILALICSLLTAWAQTNPPIVLSRLTPLVLQGESTNFTVLFTPSTNGPILKTNSLLTIHDAPADVLNGQVMLTVRTVTIGGESPPETIWINLQRPPAKPVMRGILLNAKEADVPVEDLMFLRRRARAQIMAPAPPGAFIPVVAPPAPTPLPGGIPATYRQFLEREQAGVRRSE